MFGKVKSLRELFEIQLAYAYDCEQRLAAKGLPSMIQGCHVTELRSAFEEHLIQTQTQIGRLERAFSSIGIAPDRKSNEIVDQIMKAAEDSVANIDPSPLRDAALVTNANQVEHYEIALYGSLVAFARSLGFVQAEALLAETLKEEKLADTILTEIAENVLNVRAARSTTA